MLQLRHHHRGETQRQAGGQRAQVGGQGGQELDRGCGNVCGVGYLDTWQKILWPQDQGQCEAREASPPLSLMLRILPNIGRRGDGLNVILVLTSIDW